MKKGIAVKVSNFLQITGIINTTVKPSQIQKHTTLKSYNTLELPVVLYRCETGAIGKKDKSRITSVETKFMRTAAKNIWQDCKTNEDVLSALKISPVVKKIENCRSKWMHVRGIDRDSLPHFIMKYEPCGKRSQGRTLKRLLDR
jgi:hypothetical protein